MLRKSILIMTILNPTWVLLGLQVKSVILLFCYLFCSVMLNIKTNLAVRHQAVFIFSVLLLASLFHVVQYLVSCETCWRIFNEFNYSYLGNIIVGATISFLLYKSLKDTSIAITYLEEIIIWTAVVNIFVVSVEFISHDFRVFKEGFLYNYGTNIDYAQNYFKFRGIAGGAGSTLSILYALSFIFFARRQQNIFIIGLFLLIIIFGIYTSGRAGLIFIILYYSLWFALKSIYHSLILSLCLPLVTYVFFSFLTSLDISRELQYALLLMGNISEIYYAIHLDELLIEYKNAYSADNIINLLFGTGSFSGGMEPPHQGDSSFSRIISAYGFLGYSLYLAFTTYLIYRFRREKTYVLLILVTFIFSFKEVILFEGYFSRFFWSILFLKMYQTVHTKS